MKMTKFALTSTSGKLGHAVLTSLLEHNLVSPSDIIICTSSDPSSNKYDEIKSKGAEVRRAPYEDPVAMENAFAGCDRLFLVSTPRSELDFHNAAPGTGREAHHIAAIEAALRAGVKHIYYTSLGFDEDSKAAVMWAHNRTEKYLRERVAHEKWTVLREGLYSESWPLYLGYFDPEKDDRGEVQLGGDGKISWTAIPDLGLATALILVAEDKKYAGQVITLSATEAYTMEEVAELVSKYRGQKVTIKLVSREEYEKHYVEERGRDAPAVQWWASTYSALPLGECLKDDQTFTDLLASKGRSPKPFEETVKEMLSS